MDTYFDTNHNCVGCGECVKACPVGCLFIEEVTDYNGQVRSYIDCFFDVVPCHHCDGFDEDNTPCQRVCKADAIELSRW